ncbi:MAG: fructose-6-phosphate aldolase [Bacteriovoracales bacterium]|nr:fructose-6-phosphate aldolase [Bacteriovoracales bacterium]
MIYTICMMGKVDFFIDSADPQEIKKALSLGLVDGVTTNPSLMAKEGRKPSEVIREIADLVQGPISAEVLATDAKGMIEEGKKLARIHDNVTIKLPMTEEGIVALGWFSQNNIKTNLTLVFSPLQALVAAKNGASFVSPFIGRLDDIGHSGMQLIREIKTIFDNYRMETKILAASVRHPEHVREAALAGAHVATCPYDVLKKIFAHPLTDKGLKAFLSDAKKAGLSV